jgi:hypothetical protein
MSYRFAESLGAASEWNICVYNEKLLMMYRETVRKM